MGSDTPNLQRPEPQGSRAGASRESGRGEALAAYVASGTKREIPDAIISAAITALIDHVGVAVGGAGDHAAVAARKVADAWAVPGRARVVNGGLAGAGFAAMVNATAAHCMDFDDTHLWGGGHISAPCWATALALAQDRGLDEMRALRGFVAGFEVMARLGGGGINGVGRSMQQRGFHPTAVNGVIGAAAVAAAMLELSEEQTMNALSVAATGAFGLVASFGSDSKPFHAGRAALEGILSADLAAAGFEASKTVFERDKGMLDAFVQDRSAEVPDIDFSTGWELLNNGYKPFACCRATHASIQAAQSLAAKIGGRAIQRVVAKVHKNAPFTAGKLDPKTPLEAKFSVPFCIAMGLRGYRATESDFAPSTLADADVAAIVPLVEMQPVETQPQYEAYLDVHLQDGTALRAETNIFLGHPDNPMTDDMRDAKFLSLAEPVLGRERAGDLLATLRAFAAPGALAKVSALTAGNEAHGYRETAG